MTSSNRIPIKPEVIVWARKSAGLDEVASAKRLNVNLATFQAWESGEISPTIVQLRKAAKTYRRPLAVLLLSEPPKDFDALRDFRLVEGAALSWSPKLNFEYRRAASQREAFLEISELSPRLLDTSSPSISLTLDVQPEEAGTIIRNAIGKGYKQQRKINDPRAALNVWIASVEALGVLVVHIRQVDVKEMRGFSISEWPFPLIALNGNDSERGRIFTLLHELSHLSLNAGGICDLHESSTSHKESNDYIEHYCNQVAAATLMPKVELLRIPEVQTAQKDTKWSLEELASIGQVFNASSEALLLRFISLGKASWELYWERKPELEKKYEEARRQRKEKLSGTDAGKLYYILKAHDMGYGYIASVLEAFHSRVISSVDVADYLGIRYDQLPKLERAALR